MKKDRVLFGVGFALLIVSFLMMGVFSTIMSQALMGSQLPQMELFAIIGMTIWITMILGIILTGVGYWKKPRKQ
jgi:uncharacterized membrane protein YiaA